MITERKVKLITEWKEDDPCRSCDFNPRKRGFNDVCSSTEFENSCYAYERYKAGMEAQRRLLEYLTSQCTEHPKEAQTMKDGVCLSQIVYKVGCPECLKEIAEELEKEINK